MKETHVGSLILILRKASLYTRRTTVKSEKIWKTMHANVSQGRHVAVSISKAVTTMFDGSGHWASIKSALVRQFAREGARGFNDEAWQQMILEGSTKKRIEYCKDKDGFLCYLRAIQRHSGGIPIEPEFMHHVFVFHNWKEKVRISKKSFMELPIRI